MGGALIEVMAALLAPLAAGALIGALMGALRTGGAAASPLLLLYGWETAGFGGVALAPVALASGAAATALLAARALRAPTLRAALDLPKVRRLGPWAAAGGAAAALGLSQARPAVAAAALGGAAVLAALAILFRDPKAPAPSWRGWRGPLLGLGLGALAGGAAQGAGAAGAPLLRPAGAPERPTEALLAALGLAAAAPAALVFLAFARPEAAPPFALGALDLPTVILVPAIVALTAPHGAAAAKGWPPRALAFGHGLLLMVVGLALLQTALAT